MKCPLCEGKNGWYEDFGEGTINFEKCPICKDGQVTIFYMIRYWIWNNITCRFYE